MSRADAGEDTGKAGNVASHLQLKIGDVEQGFKDADVVIEREYNTQTVHQGYIEPFACTAQWMQEGRLTIWTCTQGIFGVRGNVAAILDIPESMIKVVPMEIGGGFGGKGTGYLEPVAAVLSRKTGQPVKMVMSRKEVFEGTGPSSGSYIRCKIGAKNDGTFTSAQLYMVYEAGAYPGSPMAGGATSGLSAYNLDNALVDGYDVVCNKPKTAAYRAPGHPQVCFAVECCIDELAQMLDMDPMDLRIKNVAQEGDRAVTGVPHAHVGLREVMEAIKEHPHYNAPLGGPNRARGVATGYRLNGGGSGSSATINVLANGTVTITTGSMDLSGTRRGRRHAGGRGARPGSRRRHTPGGGHGLRRLDGRLRRQPDHLRYGTRFNRRSTDCHRPDERPRSPLVGSAAGGRGVRGRLLCLHQEPGGPVHVQGAGGQTHGHRRPRYLLRNGHAGRRWRRPGRQHLRRGSGPGDWQGGHRPRHRLPGHRPGRSPLLRRGPDAGRHPPGHRLGLERRSTSSHRTA